jgi:indole-3-glycerol phosphate synthase
MWDKETEVDRFRERVPLVNLVSQCRLSQMDPKAPKPRGFVVPIQQMVSEGKFVVIPECKRMEPTIGSLRRRYDLSKLARDFTFDGAVAISVNCDAVLFGGSLGDVTAAREAAGSAVIDSISEEGVVVPPILASDLILYPYQLYKLRLAGADAINLLVGALEKKDLSYLTKIASSLQLQSFATVTSEVQLLEVESLQEGTIDGIIVSNRELEDFSFDMTGEQALYLLKSNALAKVRAKHGEDLLILAEGRVGIIDRPQADSTRSAKLYITELREAGAVGAIMGGALAVDGGGYQQVAKMAQL